MATSIKLRAAFQLFDEANQEDPNIEVYGGKRYPKEFLYALRMTDTLTLFNPNASDVLHLTARCQHICRWEIPRDLYSDGRVGYLKWRQDLKKFHAQKAIEILKKAGYDMETIAKVEFLLLKKQLKKNEDTQCLEDVICLVFLNYYLEPFIRKHEDEKVISILQKTWKKMSEKGQKAALQLSFSKKVMPLIHSALNT